MNRYVVGIVMLFAVCASSNAMGSRITRAARTVAAAKGLRYKIATAGILAAGGLATQLPNGSQPVGDIKPGDYRCPQKLKFTVDPAENPGDPRYPGGYLSIGVEALNNTEFLVTDGEIVGMFHHGTKNWEHITINLPNAHVHMQVGHDPLTADSRCTFLSSPDSNETFHVCTPAHKKQKLRVQALYADEQPHGMTPKSLLTVKREQAYDQEGGLQRWFGWMKFWGNR